MNDTPSRQLFHFGAWTFDIQAAAELLRANPRTAAPLDVKAWARAYGLDNFKRQGVPLLGVGPDFDPAYAMTADLTAPVLVATVQSNSVESAPLLIDGCHRLYRASVEDLPILPAYVLTAAETLVIRDDRWLSAKLSSVARREDRS